MILVTGATGMIGNRLVLALLEKGYDVIGVDRRDSPIQNKHYISVIVDLADKEKLNQIYVQYPITHTIHLAALAHTNDVFDLSDKAYRQANVINAQNVFEAGKDAKLLFISTVDVYGFTKGTVSERTEPNPVTIYGKTKAEAESILRRQGGQYDIFRFSPVYTEEIKRDIQKRYYLKYPNWAYLIGKGSGYEVLDIKNAVLTMVDWVDRDECKQSIQIIKDKALLETTKILAAERKAGRAKYILHFPRWLVNAGYTITMIGGENKYTYLLNKAVHPLRSE